MRPQGSPLLGADVWQGWDVDELRNAKVSKAKSIAFTALLAMGYAWLSSCCPVEASLPAPSTWRLGIQGILAVAMAVEFGVSLFGMPPSTKDAEIFELIRRAGKTVFLTYWILSLQTIYAVAGLHVEVQLWLGSPHPRLHTLNYKAAAFFDTIGIVLTLLFLKFNWFEKRSQQNMRAMWEKRGFRFGLLALMPSLPVGIVDWLTRDEGFRAQCQLPHIQYLGLLLALSALYMTWIHIWWACTGYIRWPYPFLHTFNTLLKLIILTAVIMTAMFTLLVVLTALPSVQLPADHTTSASCVHVSTPAQ